TPEMASHKGYGLAMMVQVLSATLGGAAFGASRQAGPEGQDNSSEGQDNSSEGRAGSSDDVGHFFLALDPRAFRAEGEFEADLDDALDLLRATPAVDPALPVLVPGDPEAAASEERARRGVPVPDVLCRALRDICERAGAPFLLDESAAG
ncbi:MAG: Ldh family oxidoreductase, partial [Micromonosporaceae bacterium]